MITEKQLKIFEVFVRNPFFEFSRKQVKKEAREKSNNKLALTIRKLKDENIILEKIVGKSGLLSLNLNEESAFNYISLCNNSRLVSEIKKAIKRLKDEINLITPFYAIVIFGSYVNGKQTKLSDLDISIFIENEEKRKKIEAVINSVKLKTLINLDVQVIPKAEMIEMLINDEENLGKQIVRKHIAVYNLEIFYNIINEGMKRGFRI